MFSVDEAEADEAGDPVARTMRFRDVTDRQTQEQRLTVLNRGLRHNVRNDLDVVLAYADHISDDEIQTGIKDRATELLELSDKARDAEDVMTASTEPPEPVNIANVAESVVEQFQAGHYPGDILFDTPDEVLVSSHRTVVREVLSELVENALVHSEKALRTLRSVCEKGRTQLLNSSWRTMDLGPRTRTGNPRCWN